MGISTASMISRCLEESDDSYLASCARAKGRAKVFCTAGDVAGEGEMIALPGRLACTAGLRVKTGLSMVVSYTSAWSSLTAALTFALPFGSTVGVEGILI